jgi:leucyl-tRNA synthetase
MMEIVNELYAFSENTVTGSPGRRRDEGVTGHPPQERPETVGVVGEALGVLVRMLAPFAPHTCEELWGLVGEPGGLAAATWPAYDEKAAKADEIVIPVQVNGKVRGRLTVAAEIEEAELQRLALADPAVQGHIAGRDVTKVVVARGRLVSVVVR